MRNAVFGKFKPESIRAQVTAEIERKIFSGELAIGQRLPPERELAEQLGVSRSLVNLAILDLESMGFLRIVPRQGTFVADYKTQSTPQMLLSLMMNGTADNTGADLFISMLETRRLLESECARLAAKNASEEDLEKLSSILEEMRTAASPADFSDGNFRFHRALMAASGNIVYAMIFQSFQKVVLFYVTRYFTTKERIRLSLEQHEALLAALKARDEERSLREVRVIMEEGISSLTKMFAPGGAKGKNPSVPRG
ncbi:MAG TPA: FadR/GntR family transcriptional regulator [Eubacteriales bacterium]|nr:FadR/GntR family transcriptional regulator [Eubacteriales bacterium]